MKSGDRNIEEDKLLNAHFPISKIVDYDFHFQNSLWRVGADSHSPQRFRDKLAAAIISEQLGLKSLDHIMNTYIHLEDKIETTIDRLDIRIKYFIENSMNAFESQIDNLAKSYGTGNRLDVFGTLICEWTLSRCKFSMSCLLLHYQQGALFEGVSIARFMIEQIAWAHSIQGIADEEAVLKISAQAAISNFKKIRPSVGNMYGWMSKHAHWNIDAHKKSMISRGGGVGHLFASPFFKVQISIIMIYILNLAYFSVWDLYSEEMKNFQNERGSAITSLKNIRFASEKFLDEIILVSPDDGELCLLIEIFRKDE